MKIAVFLNELSLGGTEKAACRWALGFQQRGHTVTVVSMKDGPRRTELEQNGIPLRIVSASESAIATALREFKPDLVHAHAPGYPHAGDILGSALNRLQNRLPVVQTNVFGRLDNPAEDAWTRFRLFISWTSCIQAARRAFIPLDEDFFAHCSVAVYPLDPTPEPDRSDIARMRAELGIREEEVVFGRFSRPEPNKWTSLALDAFRLAVPHNRKIKLLLREPPPAVNEELRKGPDADRFIILPATADAAELRHTMAAVDAVLHTSSIGESFGYGIAEPMALGKPVITHSIPWGDQAQIELVRHGEGGWVASTPRAMASYILKLAADESARKRMGAFGRKHILELSDPDVSVTRIERILEAVLEGKPNPFLAEDLERARRTAEYLDRHQFGHSLGEQLALRPRHYRVRFHQWRHRPRNT
ncbi:MAG TPA: glycosyltransferase family 4 protein [Verrucomicrobiota bacterium]|nr:glycosyltransferase family 4 protein [Verrucomicrobiota bacterium]